MTSQQRCCCELAVGRRFIPGPWRKRRTKMEAPQHATGTVRCARNQVNGMHLDNETRSLYRESNMASRLVEVKIDDRPTLRANLLPRTSDTAPFDGGRCQACHVSQQAFTKPPYAARRLPSHWCRILQCRRSVARDPEQFSLQADITPSKVWR